MAAARRGVGNLPAELTSFVGRRGEVAEVKRLLSRSRLVTLTGVGGVGKTRLALRAAAGLRRAFGDGVWLVKLDQVRDEALVAQAVAGALGLHARSGFSPEAALAEYVAVPGGALTPRELQVARLLARGRSNKEIAAELVISPRTAEGHVERILTKLGFASRAQVAASPPDDDGR